MLGRSFVESQKVGFDVGEEKKLGLLSECPFSIH